MLSSARGSASGRGFPAGKENARRVARVPDAGIKAMYSRRDSIRRSLLPPSAGLRGYAIRHHDLMGVKERELRRIQILQDQISQASINVNRLMVDLQFVNGQVLAAQPNSWDCNLPQIPRDVDRKDFSTLPFANAAEDETASTMTPIPSKPRTTTTVTTATGTIPSSTLVCSPTKDDSMN